MQNDWAFNEIVRVPLWDPRCRHTLTAACEVLAENAQMSFSQALGSRRKAVSRILHHQDTTQQDLLSGHIRATQWRCQQEELTLIASDTSSMDFSSHKATQGLGPISDKKHLLGFFVHSALAMTKKGVPLGLLHQSSWARDPNEAGIAKQRYQRAYADKESHKWLEAMRAVEEKLSAGQKAILIQDREADVFEFFSAPRKEGLDLIIRASQPRRIEARTELGPTTLFVAMAQAGVVATKTIHVTAGPKRVERNAALTVRTAKLFIRPPKNGSDPNGPAISLWVVRASEENPPEGVKEPLEWVLLTTLAVEDAADALRILDYYTFRWRIERFHFVLKSGCGYERLQLDRLDTLEKALSLYSIVAWRLLYLTYLAREAPDTPAEEAISVFEKDVLELFTRKPVNTVRDVILAVAKLAGFVSVPSAPNPGAKTLWQGFRKLQDMTAGYLLARQSLH
ncbi:MAG: IS4-like element ISGvi2 family transposase [Acidobacteriaceae bacterium]